MNALIFRKRRFGVTKAHVENCSDVISEALKAVYVKNSR
jgi:hypothetical protein